MNQQDLARAIKELERCKHAAIYMHRKTNDPKYEAQRREIDDLLTRYTRRLEGQPRMVMTQYGDYVMVDGPDPYQNNGTRPPTPRRNQPERQPRVAMTQYGDYVTIDEPNPRSSTTPAPAPAPRFASSIDDLISFVTPASAHPSVSYAPAASTPGTKPSRIKAAGKAALRYLVSNTVAKVLAATIVVGAPVEYNTHIVEKAVGTACLILPHYEQGRFWEGVHMYQDQAQALDNEVTVLEKVQGLLPELPDLGVLPDVSVLDEYPISPDNAVTVRAANGDVIYEKPATQIYLSELPENVKRALVLREDAEFYDHAGINWKGIARAALFLGKRGGGSSLEMQVAKQIALDNNELAETNVTRKITDMLGAVELDVRYEKDEILTFYGNYMYFGNGNYGVESAANDYFGKTADELAFNEAVFLACLLNDPGNNPKTDKGFDVQWEDYKREITKLVDKGEISEKEGNKYTRRGAIKIQKPTKRTEQDSMYASTIQTVYVHALQQDMGVNIRPAVDGNERFYSVDITTTVGPVTTEAAYAAMQEADIPEHAQASIVVLGENQEIKAIIGTKEAHTISEAPAKPNTAIERARPMGSTFKPLYFSFAVDHDLLETDELLDESTPYTDGEGDPVPRNWDGLYEREFSPHGALVNSNNRVAVQVYDRIQESLFGLRWNGFIDYLADIGLQTNEQFQDKNDWTYALGTQTATGVELAQAYNTVFNNSNTGSCQPYIIESIKIGNETMVYRCNAANSEKEEGVGEENKNVFTRTLETIAQQHGVRNQHGRVGFKTGTTNDATLTRVAGVYHRKGVDYSFVIDVDGQGQSLGGSASKIAAPLARTYFAELN